MDARVLSRCDSDAVYCNVALCDQIRSENAQHCMMCQRWKDIKMTQKNSFPVSCSVRHMRCMCLLLANKGKVLTKDAIVSHVWSGERVGYNSVSLLVHDVRFIMRDFSVFNNTHIVTVRKAGYVLISS